MTEPKKPETGSGDDDIYVIDDTGELQDVQDLAGYRARPVPAGGEAEPEGTLEPGLREENQKLRDQYLRSRADFENFRKRVEREKSEYFRYALADTLREILPALDNFERALGTDTATQEDFRKGVEMIYKQLSDALGRAGLKAIDPAGEPFDPALHEAIARYETADAEPHTVFDVLQKGYLLHDRLLRPAMVRVAVAPGEPDDSI